MYSFSELDTIGCQKVPSTHHQNVPSQHRDSINYYLQHRITTTNYLVSCYKQTTVSVKDWCTSVHGIAGPSTHTKVQEIKGISVNGPDPKPCQFSPCSDKRCARYLLWKIHAPGKVGQSSPKSLKICYASMPIITLGWTNFCTLILAPQRDLLGRSSPI